ncbi:MAG: sigma-54 dependent transcriptional regulator [Pirellulaceae bacterium]|jgi:two-component system nitrogen regulation response regulator GlnG|nr:sigma-54 dependent transcriptional regulator [Pirellulaceae bacterium]
MPGVLVIDDDRSVVHLIRSACQAIDVEVQSAQSAEEGLALVKQLKPDVVLLDIVLPGCSGLALFQELRDIDSRVPVIFITAGGESDTAIEAMKIGALDFMLKPLDVARIRELVNQALEIRRLMETPVELPELDRGSDGELIGRSPQMLEVYKAIGRVAPQTVTVLIRGESGTGKELIARAIYQHSARRGKPFLAVNCAALPETLLESELFGHEKGSFTGADHRRIGKFEQCNGGTIFLDEVGDMAPLVQAKLLRLLQEQRFERVGGNETITTDVRIITATNRDLEAMTADGTFRPDLYYRLNGFTIKLPPLRERGDDLLVLIEAYLGRYARELDKSLQRVSPEALKVLLEYPWPGNVRELQNILRKSLLNLSGSVLLPEFLPEEIRASSDIASAHSSSSRPMATADDGDLPRDLGAFLQDRLDSCSENVYAEAVEFMERYVVTRVLQSTGGNQSKAAKILGITRGSLRNKTHSLGIKIGQVVSSASVDEEEEGGE